MIVANAETDPAVAQSVFAALAEAMAFFVAVAAVLTYEMATVTMLMSAAEADSAVRGSAVFA